jgi:hypothetical protein
LTSSSCCFIMTATTIHRHVLRCGFSSLLSSMYVSLVV